MRHVVAGSRDPIPRSPGGSRDPAREKTPRPPGPRGLHLPGRRGAPAYRSVTTWETGSPIMVPIRPYPAMVVPVMQVDIIMPPAVQSP